MKQEMFPVAEYNTGRAMGKHLETALARLDGGIR